MSNKNPIKTGCELRCSGRGYAASVTCRLTQGNGQSPAHFAYEAMGAESVVINECMASTTMKTSIQMA